jgi:hypothetical protein
MDLYANTKRNFFLNHACRVKTHAVCKTKLKKLWALMLLMIIFFIVK